MSPWYQARPKGALGTWITKKSNSVFGGSPLTSTSISSTGPSEVTFTRPVTSAAQLAPPFMAAAERTMSNLIFGFGSARAGADPPRHSATRVASPVTAQSLREGIGEYFSGCGRQLMEVETSPRLFVVLSFM